MIGLCTEVRLNGITAVVADPCYFRSAEHMLTFIHDLAPDGSWLMETTPIHLSEWGNRVAELTVVHSSWSAQHEFTQIGRAGVDSGQMSIVGSDDVAWFQDPEDAAWDPEGNRGQFSYQGACDITLNTDAHAGVLDDRMAVSTSGIGDGVYPVNVWRDENGLATRITVDFLSHILLEAFGGPLDDEESE